MDPRIINVAGCSAIAVAFVFIAMPLPMILFAIMCYVAATAIFAAGVAPFVASLHRNVAAVLYAVAAVAVFVLVYQLIGATLDLVVFFFLAFGLVMRTFAEFAHGAPGARRAHHGVLVGAVGAAIYLVHDITVGYTKQIPADALLLFGFVMLWITTLTEPIEARQAARDA